MILAQYWKKGRYPEACYGCSCTKITGREAARSAPARAFAQSSGCEIISDPGLCDADSCFQQGGRCDRLGEIQKCFPHMLLNDGTMKSQRWMNGEYPKACYKCSCATISGWEPKDNGVGNPQSQGVGEAETGGGENDADADFRQFLRVVVLGEKPATQTTQSPKRKSPNEAMPTGKRTKQQ